MTTLLFFAVFLISVLIGFRKFKWGYFFFFFCYFAYPKVFSLGVGNQGFAFTMTRAQLLVMTGLIFLRLILLKNESRYLIRVISQNPTPFALTVALFIWKIFTSLVQTSMEVSTIVGLLDDFLLTIIIFLSTIVAIRSKQDLQTLIRVLAFGLVINTLAGYYEILTQKSLFEGVEIDYAIVETGKTGTELLFKEDGAFRIQAFFTSPLHLAYLFLYSFPLIFLAFRSFGYRLKKKLLYLYVLFATPIILFFTRSRGALLFFLLSFGLMWAYNYIRKTTRSFLVFRVIIFGGIIFLIASIVLFGEAFFSLANEILIGEATSFEDDASASERLDQFQVFLRADPNLLAFGMGRLRYIPGLVDVINHLDNYYIKIFMETGLPGLTLFLSYLVVVIRYILKLLKTLFKLNDFRRDGIEIFLLLIGLMFIGLNFTASKIMNLYIYAIPAVACIYGYWVRMDLKPLKKLNHG